MPRRTSPPLLAALSIVVLAAAACSSSSGAGKTSGATVNVGVGITLSGPFGVYGKTSLNGIKLAVHDINAAGGVLGKKVRLVARDDQLDPATGQTVTRNLILDDHVVALVGSIASSVAAAQETLSAQYRVPILFHEANEASLMRSKSKTYAFMFTPNTEMEPAAAALAFARKIGQRHVRIATITPNYNFGLDTVKTFLADLRKDGASFTVTDQQTPALGATSYTSNLAAIMAANPDYVFVGEYGSDLITLTKQGRGLGLFSRATVGAMYDSDVLAALGAQAPAGALAWDRAPFWTDDTAQMKQFVSKFKAAYGRYPNEFAITAYASVQSWAHAVRQAKSFAADKVSAALAGANVPTVRGELKIRACDHQAEVSEATGTIAAATDPRYGLRLWDNVYVAPAAQILKPCA
jgi:branched-chain amino acid transport system substrate-binding protein